jgi:hypothetical protein
MNAMVMDHVKWVHAFVIQDTKVMTVGY